MILSLHINLKQECEHHIGVHVVYEKIHKLLGDSKERRIAFICDKSLFSLHGQHLAKKISDTGFNITPLFVPEGEACKTQTCKEGLENSLAESGFCRSDLAGYVASTYLRGIPFISIPTTLIGMVDAAIGGKNGVNGTAKNLFGSFYLPEVVLIDPLFLSTLSSRALKNGFAEMVKHGLIATPAYFAELENIAGSLTLETLAPLLEESLKIKLAIVGQDPFDRGMRSLLNFGHTFGHAIEIASKGALQHGESVAIGILIESWLSTLLTGLPRSDFDRIMQIFARAGFSLPTDFEIPFENLLLLLVQDKKRTAGAPRCVLLQRIGQPAFIDQCYTTPLSLELLKEAHSFLGSLHDTLHHYS